MTSELLFALLKRGQRIPLHETAYYNPVFFESELGSFLTFFYSSFLTA